MKPRQRALLGVGIVLALAGFGVCALVDRIVHYNPEARRFRIINVHEHVQSPDVIPAYLIAADRLGIHRTILLGSPEATLIPGRTGFTGIDANNQAVLSISKERPEKFIPFVTLDPLDPGHLDKLKAWVRQGARGLKLYSGHAVFHTLPLNDERMEAVYTYCETTGLPVLFHVNAGYYFAEFEDVLKKHPRLKVICPHFCLSTIRVDRFAFLMEQYPNLYTDISFGSLEYLKSGLLRFSGQAEMYRKVILKYQDRIFFGTDMVLTQARYKTADWYYQTARVYRDFLEKESYLFSPIEGLTLRGLHLGPEVLEKIYHRNFEKFMKRDMMRS